MQKDKVCVCAHRNLNPTGPISIMYQQMFMLASLAELDLFY